MPGCVTYNLSSRAARPELPQVGQRAALATLATTPAITAVAPATGPPLPQGAPAEAPATLTAVAAAAARLAAAGERSEWAAAPAIVFFDATMQRMLCTK